MKLREPHRNKASRIILGQTFFQLPYINFIETQLNSFDWFKQHGFDALFADINPVKDSMEKLWTMEFKSFKWGEPNRTIREAIDKGLSYDVPITTKVQLLNNKTGEIKEQEVFLTDFPMMTDEGYFVINGVKRVVMHQMVRAEGVLFDENETLPDRKLYKAVLMPARGTWYSFEVSKSDVITVKFGKNTGRVLITEILRVLGYESNEDIKKLFADVDTNPDRKYIDATLARDFSTNKQEAVINVYSKLRSEETATLESAEKYIKSLFFNDRKFSLGKVGRYQLNRKLDTKYDIDSEAKLYIDDLIRIVKRLIKVNNGEIPSDDVDHLQNRRIRSIGETIIDQLTPAMRRLEKMIKDKMSTYGEDAKLTPSTLVGSKTLSIAVQSFFGQNQLSSFMDQTNILSELENKRKITSAGPGGVTKERAPFSLREVHQSQYSRICPVTTPESNSVGVVTQIASLAKINEYGFLEAPYKKVLKTAKNNGKMLINKIVANDIFDNKNKKIASKGDIIDSQTAKKIQDQVKDAEIEVYPYITDQIDYIDAMEEDTVNISFSNVDQDEFGNITATLVPIKTKGNFVLRDKSKIDYVDVHPSQVAGLGLALIPYGSNDHSRRTLMGSNHQRQGVPLVKQEAPKVGTGFEEIIGRQSKWTILAEDDGVVEYADANKVAVRYGKSKVKEYEVIKFDRSNDDTCLSQRVKVGPGQKVKKDDLIIDGPTIVDGELSIGTNLRVALMFFEGYNYEDSTVISDRLIKEDVLTSIHIKEYTTSIMATDLGDEMLTCDIPFVNETVLQKLNADGVIRVGQRVVEGDILAGVVAPRGERELTAEERLLKAIFGESSKDVKDNSLRVPNGEKGVVIKTQILDSSDGEKLPPGVLKKVKVWLAQTKKIDYGDKLTGRHGDKATIAEIRPVEDMPFTADGKPIDIILTPMFIKRMNMGQIAEIHLGNFADKLGVNFGVPIFEKIGMEWVKSELEKKGFAMEEKEDLYDGRTGEKFPRKVTVGYKYMLKLHHIADEKLHARSTGPYTLVTQQPLGGKAQMGGQRFGEMEVWALQAHGTPYALQEMLTIKSDDVKGRANAYKAIIQGEKIPPVNIPESFKVLIRELNALCLNIDLISKPNNEDDQEKIQPAD